MQCSFDKLVLYLDKQLDLDGELEVLDHIDECENCHDAVYQITRDRDAEQYGVRRRRREKVRMY